MGYQSEGSFISLARRAFLFHGKVYNLPVFYSLRWLLYNRVRADKEMPAACLNFAAAYGQRLKSNHNPCMPISFHPFIYLVTSASPLCHFFFHVLARVEAEICFPHPPQHSVRLPAHRFTRDGAGVKRISVKKNMICFVFSVTLTIHIYRVCVQWTKRTSKPSRQGSKLPVLSRTVKRQSVLFDKDKR